MRRIETYSATHRLTLLQLYLVTTTLSPAALTTPNRPERTWRSPGAHAQCSSALAATATLPLLLLL